MKFLLLNYHSFVDLITNSSSENFVIKPSQVKETIEEFLEAVYKEYKEEEEKRKAEEPEEGWGFTNSKTHDSSIFDSILGKPIQIEFDLNKISHFLKDIKIKNRSYSVFDTERTQSPNIFIVVSAIHYSYDYYDTTERVFQDSYDTILRVLLFINALKEDIRNKYAAQLKVNIIPTELEIQYDVFCNLITNPSILKTPIGLKYFYIRSAQDNSVPSELKEKLSQYGICWHE